MKLEGKESKNPLKESFTQWKNLKIVILALFGAVAGQAAISYGSVLNMFFFMTHTLKVWFLTYRVAPKKKRIFVIFRANFHRKKFKFFSKIPLGVFLCEKSIGPENGHQLEISIAQW